jgi:hypothetical protein
MGPAALAVDQPDAPTGGGGLVGQEDERGQTHAAGDTLDRPLVEPEWHAQGTEDQQGVAGTQRGETVRPTSEDAEKDANAAISGPPAHRERARKHELSGAVEAVA